MRRILLALLVGLLLYGVTLSAATGLFVAVEVEVFEPWSILHWGSWNPLEEELLSTRIQQISEEDIEAATALMETCELATDLRGAASGSCHTLTRFHFVREGHYDINPLLGQPYRIVLRNLTAGHLGLVLAVDGLNTNGSAPVVGDASDRRWILRPFQTVAVSGWQAPADEAPAFQFIAPSPSRSLVEDLRGTIQLAVYLCNPFAEEDRAESDLGEMIDQPAVPIPFVSVTTYPVETLTFDYSPDRVTLGIQCEEAPAGGIRISAVAVGTVAEQAGLLVGDIITYADAIPMNRCSDMQELLDSKSPGDRLLLKVHRSERVFLISLTLEE